MSDLNRIQIEAENAGPVVHTATIDATLGKATIARCGRYSVLSTVRGRFLQLDATAYVDANLTAAKVLALGTLIEANTEMPVIVKPDGVGVRDGYFAFVKTALDAVGVANADGTLEINARSRVATSADLA